MSDSIVERNGKLVGRSLASLRGVLSLPEGDAGDEADELALELLEALRGERARPRPDGPLAALHEESARAATHRKASSEALRQVGYAVVNDHPVIPEDGKAYLWGTYSQGEGTALELFTEAMPQGLSILSRIRRKDPDAYPRARTTHVQKELRSQASHLFPAQDQ